jgi:type VI secretion system secreted protein VgrG
MAQPTFSLYTDSYATELEIKSITGTESISKFFELKIEFKVKKDIAASLDHLSLTQDDVYIKVEELENRDDYSIKGIFKQVEEVFEQSNTHKFYTATMVPALWRQRKNQSYDIYTNVTVENVLTDELSNDLMLDHHLSLTQAYPTKEFICQYSESNFDFVCRMSEHWGIYYYFDHDQEGRLVFADDTNYEPLAIPAVKLDESNNPTNSFNSIRSLRRQFNSVPDAVIIAETNPDQAMELFQGIAGEVSDDKTSVNMADEGADNKDEAELLAQIRLQELQANQIVFTGTTGLPCITPGFVLTVELPDGDSHEILITEVNHNGQNLDDSARAQDGDSQPYYECSFSGIPKETQYRPARRIKTPAVISTTGRVYSAADDQTLAQRNEVGKYQVTFDFMKGEEDKISNWIRHASHASRSNHFDIPLTPGTEVQIGFIGGNPNRPYILNALENSQSVIHPVTHENPHHAAMITDGMLYTGALKSRQSLHMTAKLDPTEVKDHINNNALTRLDTKGIDSCELLDTIKGDEHINRTYGERYQWREGVDFNYGLNATYNFGQQHTENHADNLTADTGVFDIPGLDSADSSTADEALQPGLSDERKVGIIQKDFGNKYNYHEGHAYNWSTGYKDQGLHKTLNFGGCYVENNTSANAPSDMVNDHTSGFPSSPSDSDLTTRTIGNTFELQEGNQVDVLTGNFTSEMTGDTDETITGNITSNVTGDTAETIMGNVETTLTGDITETITGNTNTTKMGDDTIMHTGNQTITTMGDIINNHTGSVTNSDLNTTYSNMGTYTSTFAGGYIDAKLALAAESFMGGKAETHQGPLLQGGKLKNEKMNVSINNYSQTLITKTNINVINAKITMVG